ncbi:hypothetical protein [Ruminococcus sp.]|uniref:hypothetical protein n=1 Tax=Ruminococcus sp. TaxID=41978 RepID=UPI0025E6E49A|nr:hypothetical protein [Ruminococcus sp.]MBQ8966549.1 hypothetical protein [Ruminococcus sp.]
MRRKFNFKSRFRWVAAILGPAIIVAGTYPGAMLALAAGKSSLMALFIILSLIPALGLTVLLDRVPSSFSAEENSVTFVIFFRKRVIPYEDIEDIEVGHEYVDPLSQRERPYYREDIKFITKAGDICYSRRMNIDMYATADDPESLKAQIEDGDFNKLRRFILARKAGR